MPSKLIFAQDRYAKLSNLTDDATLNRAFRLAHSLYQYREKDRKIALNILWDALKHVEVRLKAQVEADRHAPPNPTKVRWSVIQWLQIMIYCISEKYEKEQESADAASLTQQDMVIRYLKHLILVTCRRNSFHVALGLCRLVYNYSPAETISIYDLIFQDPDSSTKKADAYYRARKNKLLEEMKRRFGKLVHDYQGLRGEIRFQPVDDSSQFSGLVAEYLGLFSPWETSCELPERLNPWDPIYSLAASQVSQIHAVINPACFSKIAQVLKLDLPRGRLSLPRFYLSGMEDCKTYPPEDSPRPTELNRAETTAIRNSLTKRVGRRELSGEI